VEIPETVCASPLGMENGMIPDSAIVASSRRYNHGPEQGRLNNQGNVVFQNIIVYAIKPKSRK